MQTNKQDVVKALPYMLAYPALLAGYKTIDEAVNDQLLSNYLSAFFDEDGCSQLQEDSDVANRQWLSQFLNPAVNDPLAVLCSNGAPRLPAYILPTLLDLLANNKDIHRMAFLVAAYGHYLAERSKGTLPPDSDLRPDDWAKISSDDVVALLSISSMATARLQTYAHFVAMYKSYRTQIAKYGVTLLLRQMAYNRMAVQQ